MRPALLLALSLVLTAPSRAASQAELPRVVVLATGGTIASTYDEEIGALRAALTGDEIVSSVPGLSEIVRYLQHQCHLLGRICRRCGGAGQFNGCGRIRGHVGK